MIMLIIKVIESAAQKLYNRNILNNWKGRMDLWL